MSPQPTLPTKNSPRRPRPVAQTLVEAVMALLIVATLLAVAVPNFVPTH